MDVEQLYRLDDADVHTQVAATFTSWLTNAPSVRGTFFASYPAATIPASYATLVDDTALGLVCASLGNSSTCGFNATINLGAANSLWRGNLDSSTAVNAGQSLYGDAFGTYCRSADKSVTFAQFENDSSQNWAALFTQLLVSDAFINAEIMKMVSGQTDFLVRMNLAFYKLARLYVPNDPSVMPGYGHSPYVAEVVMKWSQATAKTISQQWSSYNYVPATQFSETQFLHDCAVAIGVQTQHSTTHRGPIGPGGISGGGFTAVTTVQGEAVWNFLTGVPRQRGLLTNAQPNNSSTQDYPF